MYVTCDLSKGTCCVEDSTLLIDGTTETVKYEKNEKGNFLGL